MPRLFIDPPSSRALQLRPPPVGGSAHAPPRLRDLAGLTDADVLARHRPGHADPLQVPEVLLRLVGLDRVEGLPHAGIQVSRVLQLDQHQRQAVDEQRVAGRRVCCGPLTGPA
jgi:hypothetical protein